MEAGTGLAPEEMYRGDGRDRSPLFLLVTRVKRCASKGYSERFWRPERCDELCGVCRAQVFESRDLQEKWPWREDPIVVCGRSRQRSGQRCGATVRVHDRRLRKGETHSEQRKS